MIHNLKLSRRIGRFRLPAVVILMAAIVGCDNGNSFNSDTSTPSGVDQINPADPTTSIDEDTPVPEDGATPMSEVGDPSFSSAFAGGIPMGNTAQPNTAFGSVYNGALRNIYPQYLSRDLSAIKSRGGKIALMMAGPDFLYKDADGHFSLTKWKARIDRYSKVNFNSYVSDGTIIGHYMIDEPNDPANWNGRPVSGETLDEMARYSKCQVAEPSDHRADLPDVSGAVGAVPIPRRCVGAVRLPPGRRQQVHRHPCRRLPSGRASVWSWDSMCSAAAPTSPRCRRAR